MALVGLHIHPEDEPPSTQVYQHQGTTHVAIEIDGAWLHFHGDEAQQISSVSGVIDALTGIRTALQVAYAQGWRDEIASNPPFTAETEPPKAVAS